MSNLEEVLESMPLVQLHYFMDEKIGLERSVLPKTTWPLKLQSEHTNLGVLTESLVLVTIVLVVCICMKMSPSQVAIVPYLMLYLQCFMGVSIQYMLNG